MHASVLSTSVDLPLTSRLSNYVVEEEENAGTLNDGVNEGVAAIIKALLASSDPTSQNFDLARFHYLSHVSKALVVAKHRSVSHLRATIDISCLDDSCYSLFYLSS